MKDLILLIVPEIAVVKEYLLPELENPLRNRPKGMAPSRYFDDLTLAEEVGEVRVVICPEDQFDTGLLPHLPVMMENKQHVFLNFHHACEKTDALERLIFETGLQKVQLPVREGEFSQESPIVELVQNCSRDCYHKQAIPFYRSISGYRKRFRFNLQLEAAFFLAHCCSDKDRLQELVRLAPNSTVLDQKIAEFLQHVRIQRILKNTAYNLSQNADNQFFKLCEVLFDPYIFDA